MKPTGEWMNFYSSRLLGGKATLGDCITGHLNNIENVASERMVQQMQAKSDMKSKLQNW